MLPSESDTGEESLAARRKRLLREEADARRCEDREMTRVGANWADLPREILLKIFTLAAESSDPTSSSPSHVVGALPLIPRVTRVCRGWRDAVRADPAPLWRHVDISYGWCRPTDQIIAKYCKDEKWALLEYLNMADCTKLTDASIRALAEKCPRLTSLDASGARSNISAESLRTLADRLVAVRLDRLRPRAVSGASGAAKMIAGVLTPKLLRLGVAFIPALDRTLPQTVATSCPSLTALDLTGSGQHQTTLPWVSLMTGCRGLRELRLNGMGGVSGWTPSPVVGRSGDPMGRWGQQHPELAAAARRDLGWPELRVLHIGVLTTADSRGYQPGNSNVCDGLIARLLWRSPRHLIELDITGCTKLTAQAVFDALGSAGSIALSSTLKLQPP